MAALATSAPSIATRARSVLVRRAGAFTLDAAFALLIALLAGVAPTDKARLFGIGLIVGGVYILFRDGLPGPLRGRSLGKRMLGLQPIRLGGVLVDLATSARRNWTVALVFLLPGIANAVLGFRQLVFAGNVGLADVLMIAGVGLLLVEMVLVLVDPVARRIGDRMGQTRVIEA